MQNLLEYVKTLYPEKDYVKTDEDSVMNVKIPLRYSELPNIECKGHKQVSMNEIKEHFGELLDTRLRIVNGYNLDVWCFGLYCDYCRVSKIEGKYYYCKDCCKDMCVLCFGETSEEVALKNGAKNYTDRKDVLETCRKHNLVERETTLIFNCDECKESIDESRYSNIKEVGALECEDICMKCKDTEEGKKLITEKNLIKTEAIRIIDMTDFGSYFDWVPVLRDEEEYDTVLMNLNSDSPYHNQLCLMSVDDHGRCGFYTINESLEEIVPILERNYENSKNSGKDGWEEYYERPIKALMSSKNMQIHYG